MIGQVQVQVQLSDSRLKLGSTLIKRDFHFVNF